MEKESLFGVQVVDSNSLLELDLGKYSQLYHPCIERGLRRLQEE